MQPPSPILHRDVRKRGGIVSTGPVLDAIVTKADLWARAREDLRRGTPVVIEGESPILVVGLEVLSAERLATLHGLGQAQLVLSARRATTLRIPAYEGDHVRLALPALDAAGLRALADPSLDLRYPLRGPFLPLRGHTGVEAVRLGLQLSRAARLLPALLVVPLTAIPPLMTVLPLDAAPGPVQWQKIACARLPIAASAETRLHLFRSADAPEEHAVIEIGQPDRAQPVLCRLHSECFTGDIFASQKCDCGPQLQRALATIAAAGGGVLLYLSQEGRGIGLANKLRAYQLQDQGFDTVDANHRLGFEDDERDFDVAAQMLRGLGFGAVRLLTNNPRKMAGLAAAGITVTERLPLQVEPGAFNAGYLATKAARSGHLL